MPEGTVYEDEDTVWLTSVELKLDDTDTCTVYVVAPGESDQSSVGVHETLVAPLAGLCSVGGLGGGCGPPVVWKAKLMSVVTELTGTANAPVYGGGGVALDRVHVPAVAVTS